jgi:hypothetical protein
MAERRFGRIDVRPEPATVVAGETARCVVDITPLAPVRIESIRASLKATEAVVTDETHPTVKRATLYEWDDEDSSVGIVDTRQTRHVEFQWPIPIDAPGSFYEWANLLEWDCTIEIQMQGGHEWSARFPILVYPATITRSSDDKESDEEYDDGDDGDDE